MLKNKKMFKNDFSQLNTREEEGQLEANLSSLKLKLINLNKTKTIDKGKIKQMEKSDKKMQDIF